MQANENMTPEANAEQSTAERWADLKADLVALRRKAAKLSRESGDRFAQAVHVAIGDVLLGMVKTKGDVEFMLFVNGMIRRHADMFVSEAVAGALEEPEARAAGEG